MFGGVGSEGASGRLLGGGGGNTGFLSFPRDLSPGFDPNSDPDSEFPPGIRAPDPLLHSMCRLIELDLGNSLFDIRGAL